MILDDFLVNLPDCPVEFHISKRCEPRQPRTGTITFTNSMPFFAENDLGTGSTITLTIQCDEKKDAIVATLYWLNWNSFEYEELVFQ